MAASLDMILTALQNGVTAINNLNITLGQVFPQTTATSTLASTAIGTITFTSSQASAFLTVTTSSGGVYKMPLY
jgi:hypothetical protein